MCALENWSLMVFFFLIYKNKKQQQLNKYCKISLARGVFFVLHPVLKKF